MRLKIILFFFITNLFSQSSDSIYISSLKDYPLNKEVKIFYDKQWRPVTDIDSASYYRLVTFEKPNVPKGRVDDYFISGKMESNFYASYVGLSSKKNDSVFSYGPAEYYFEDPNIIRYEENYFNNKLVGNQKEYHSSGELYFQKYYKDGLAQGKQIFYYDSPEKLIELERTWVNDTLQGMQIAYYESGNTEYEFEYIDGLTQGKQTFYFDSPEKLTKSQRTYVNDTLQGIQTFYKNSKFEEVDYTKLYKDDILLERRIALVIGNENYEKSPLNNPVNDAILMAQSLKELDFDVTLVTNVSTEDELEDIIYDFGVKRNRDYEVGFVYYAGHAIQIENENYLLPTKEEYDSDRDVEKNGVSIQEIMKFLEAQREDQLNFLVLDACRNNPFGNRSRSGANSNGLAKISTPSGSLIAFSTDPGLTAPDGDGDNSLYTNSLSKNLLEPGIPIEQVFKNVYTEVYRESNNEQSPVYESKLSGDEFIMKPE